MESTANGSNHLIADEGDVLWKLMCGRLGLGFPGTVALLMAWTALTHFGLGSIISYVMYPTANIIRVFEPQHIFYSLLVVFVYTPSVWLMYFWQPRATVGALRSLRRNDVIVETGDDTLKSFADKMNRSLNARAVLLGVIAVCLAGLALETLIHLPAEAALRGRPYFWFHDKWYYFLVFVPTVYSAAYAGVMVAAKGILTLVWFNLLFRRFAVRVHPVNADGVGGFGALGNLVTKYCLIAVGVGVIGNSLMVARVLFGVYRVTLDYLALSVLFVALAPCCLIVPLWSAHRAMVRARNKQLERVSVQFDTALSAIGLAKPGSLRLEKAWQEALTLEQRREFLVGVYPTWPLSVPARRRLSLAAALPFMASMLSIVADVLGR